MFRISHYMRTLLNPTPVVKPRAPSGPVVIWNLIRRCNLTCKHCYSTSADKDFPGELSTQRVFQVMHDLRAQGVPVLILSGGEPLLRRDIFAISQRAKETGFYTALSSNGTLIDDDNIDAIAQVGYDYVGISIDGMGETHDRFRRKAGSFDAALAGLRRCVERGIKVGLRFTVTRDNANDLPALLSLMEREGVHKFYLSHLNYAGRGNRNREDDALHRMTRQVMELLLDTCRRALEAGREVDFVSGNNDADGVYMLPWARRHFPDQAQHLTQRLLNRRGNASGIGGANIDNLGNVHPDTMWWHHSVGNVKSHSFGDIWDHSSDPLMQGLKQRPRPVTGRCGACAHLAICNGNTRTRAHQLSGDYWAEDPGCYLTDEEIGLSVAARSARRATG